MLDNRASKPRIRASESVTHRSPPTGGKSDFPWKKTGFGRYSLCLIYLIANEKIPVGATYTREFRECGLTDKWLCAELVRLVPWLPILYKQFNHQSRPLTDRVVYHRWHKMFYWTGKRGDSHTCGASQEHPLNDVRLIPLVHHVDTAFKRNSTITLSTVKLACSTVGIDLCFVGNHHD